MRRMCQVFSVVVMTDAHGRPVLEATGLIRRFGVGPAAVDDLDLTLHAGAFTAIMGPSGSGKSTLLNLLAGLDLPDAGDVRLQGRSLTGLSDEDAAQLRHQHMGFVFQSFNLMPGLDALSNIRLPHRLGSRPRHPDLAWEQHLIDQLGLHRLLQRLPSELSGGEQQRVAIARALGHRPPVVFADEPTGSLDVATGRAVLTMFTELARQHGICVVMVTHDPIAASLADRVVMLRDGRIVHSGPAEQPAVLSQMLLDRVQW